MISFYITNKERSVSPIVMYVSFAGERYNKYIGESIATSKWSIKKQRVKVSPGDIEAELINEQIEKWKTAAQQTLYYFKDKPYVPVKEEFFHVLDQFRHNGKSMGNHMSIVEYFDLFIERYKPIRSTSRINHYKLAKTILKRYEDELGHPVFFEDFNQTFYNKFKSWFYKNDYSTNYFGEQIKIYKLVAREAREVDHIHDCDDFEGRNISAPQVDVENIYLSEDELMTLHKLVITEDMVKEEHPNYDVNQVALRIQTLNKARDMFLVGAYTGLRFSDFSRIRKQNVSDIIKMVSIKTGVKSIIPIHWILKEIFDNGYDFDHPLTEQNLNEHIKEVAKFAGFDDEVMLIKSRGGQFVEEVKRKYELVSTHTARRSFATNAYKAGVPTIAIMKVTGHKKESTFLKYIKVNESENAEMLKTHDFFAKSAETDADKKD